MPGSLDLLRCVLAFCVWQTTVSAAIAACHFALVLLLLCCVLQAGSPVVVYVRPEDEFFHQQAAASFTFPVEGRAVGKDELQPLRLVLLLPANQVQAAR